MAKQILGHVELGRMFMLALSWCPPGYHFCAARASAMPHIAGVVHAHFAQGTTSAMISISVGLAALVPQVCAAALILRFRMLEGGMSQGH